MLKIAKHNLQFSVNYNGSGDEKQNEEASQIVLYDFMSAFKIHRI